MPHIRIRSLKKDHVQKLSQTLIPKLSELVKSPVDHFTLELVATEYFGTVSSPFVEVLWFARPQDLQDQVAKLINQEVAALTGSQEAVIVFTELSRKSYYENGNLV